MEDTAYESVLCAKNEVLVFRIPPRPSNRGYRADEWKLDSPDWTGRLRVVSKGKELFIRLEDRNSGELFAQCPVEAHPGIAVEPVTDSSRYFVLRIKDDSGRSAFIGIGFHDRSDSFDLNVSLQDHFKYLKHETEEAKNAAKLDSGPKLDLGFKEGQTITLNLGTSSKPRNKPTAKAGGGGIGLLPPPPGGSKLPPPPAGPTTISSTSAAAPNTQATNTFQSSPAQSQGVDLLLDLGSSEQAAPHKAATSAPSQNPPDLWGDFASANQSQTASSNSSGAGWVQF
ncbi:adaptin ear-binding coat-associated protein 1 [Plakobranchus ocellatus]|uniref:Adaptin ear-binding coat-associated protein 1 n=1 Tax=Plakobranchus ocellatus TaxID=259542 RepID=A0AAV3XVY9_9GAST|nr:adaptin ear-binding coat-associated protein 1 [Plakobranchus ocellatus]